MYEKKPKPSGVLAWAELADLHEDDFCIHCIQAGGVCPACAQLERILAQVDEASSHELPHGFTVEDA